MKYIHTANSKRFTTHITVLTHRDAHNYLHPNKSVLLLLILPQRVRERARACSVNERVSVRYSCAYGIIRVHTTTTTHGAEPVTTRECRVYIYMLYFMLVLCSRMYGRWKTHKHIAATPCAFLIKSEGDFQKRSTLSMHVKMTHASNV